MKKSSIPVLMLLCLLFILPAQLISAENKPIITVLDFTTEGVSENEMKTVISLLSSSLFQMEEFTVIDVGQRENILNEIQFSTSGCSDDSCMLEIGMLLSAEMIVAGSMSRIGSRYILSTKLLETETGKTLGTADGIYNDLDMMVDDLFDFAYRLTTHLFSDVQVAEAEILSPAEEQLEVEEPQEVEKQPEVKGPESSTEYTADSETDGAAEINWKKVSGFSLISVGAIAACVGGYFFYDAAVPRTEAVDAAWTAYETAISDFENFHAIYTELYNERRDTAILGISVLSAGVLTAAGGALLLLLPEKDKSAEISAAMMPAYQSLGLYVRIRY